METKRPKDLLRLFNAYRLISLEQVTYDHQILMSLFLTNISCFLRLADGFTEREISTLERIRYDDKKYPKTSKN